MFPSVLHREKQKPYKLPDLLVATESYQLNWDRSGSFQFLGPPIPLGLMLPQSHPDTTYMVLDFIVFFPL